MKTLSSVVLLVSLFVLSVLIDGNQGRPITDHLRWAAALDWTVSALGVGVAVISALRLLHAAFQGAKLPQILPATVSLFAGLILFQRVWSIHIAFACILVCWLIVERFPRSERQPGD